MKHFGINLAEGSSITNMTIASGTSFPASPSIGELFYRTDLNALHFYDDGAWSAIGASSLNVLKAGDTMTGDLQITRSNNGIGGLAITNNSTGALASATFLMYNNAGKAFGIDLYSSNYTGFANQTWLYTDGGGLYFSPNGLAPAAMHLNPYGAVGFNGANYGTTGQVLTSQGSASTPIWSTTTGLAVSVVTGTSQTAVNGVLYVLTATGSATTVTLPTTPVVGDAVGVANFTGRTDAVVARNGSNIMQAAADKTIDSDKTTLMFRYVNSSIGWIII